jgi:hypothetical protein
MNALTTTSAPPALVPTNMREAMDLASVMAQAGFLAKELQTPGGAMFVIEQAMRWNMSPFAVAMETSFIQGKPMFSGKIVAAAAVSSGAVSGRLTYTYSGEGDNRTVTVAGQVKGEAEPSTVEVRLRDAKTNNRMWQTQPDQQLAYHGARVWARRHTPWVMLGVMSPEEFDEGERTEPREVPNLAQQRPAAKPVQDAAEYVWMAMDGKEIPVSAQMWARQLAKALAHMTDAQALRDWRAERGALFATIHESGDEGAALVEDAERAIEARIAELAEGAPA